MLRPIALVVLVALALCGEWSLVWLVARSPAADVAALLTLSGVCCCCGVSMARR